MERVGGGTVEISLRSVAERIAYDIDQLPGVLKVKPKVSAKRGGVVAEIEVSMAGDFEIPAKASEIIEVVRRSVEERVGVKLAQPPRVRVRATPGAPQVPMRPVEGEPEQE